MSTTTDTTTTPPTHIRLTPEQVRLAAQALAWRYGTQSDVDSYVNSWLLDLLPQFCGPSAQRDGLYHCVYGAHAGCVTRTLALYNEADGIPAGWRWAAGELWQLLYDARRDAQRAGLAD